MPNFYPLQEKINSSIIEENNTTQASASPKMLIKTPTELFKESWQTGLKNFTGLDLSGVNFIEIAEQIALQTNKKTVIFTGLDFSHTNLHDAQLNSLIFSGCNFTGANLTYTNLVNSSFTTSILPYADLSHTKVSGAEFIAVDLFHAMFNYAIGFRVNFSKANLKQARLNYASFIESDFIEADLAHAELRFINLEGSDLTRSNLFQATVEDAKLIETLWAGSYLKKVNFEESDLTGANLEHANLQESLLIRANLQEAQLMDADLFAANLYDSNLQKADLSRANLTNAILHSANLEYANLRGAKLNGMSLLHTSVTGVNLEATPNDHVNLNHRPPWHGSTYGWSLVKKERIKKYPDRTPAFEATSQESSAAFASRCLTTQSDPPNDCKISWSVVDRLSFSGDHTCDVNKIVIRSDSLLSEIKYLDEGEQQQWLQLAEVVKLTGNVNAVNTVKDLIKFGKIAALLPKYKQYIMNRSEQLKNSTTVKDAFLNFKEKTILQRELLFNRRSIDLQPLSKNNNTMLIFNTTLFDINTIFITKNNASYDISFDFLSSEIRELLEITQSISIYKWLSSPETLFIYQLKSGSNLIELSKNWLRGTLNVSEYSSMLIKYPEIFNPCQFSCDNLMVSNQTIIRYMLTQLVSPVNFKKPIVNVVKNASAVLPYQTVLKFSHAELMLDDEQNWLGNATSNLPITEIIDSYFKLVNRLKVSLMVTNPATHEVIMLGSSKDQRMFNHLTHDCHVVGGEKVVISGYDKFNLTQLPLPAVTLHGSKKTAMRQIDFRILAQQIKENFNSSLSVTLVTDNNDLIIKRFLQISSQTAKKNIPVISVHLKNALVDRWYQNLEIILNTTPTKITGRGLKMQLKPIPYQFPASSNNVDVLSLEGLEENSTIIIPVWIDHYSLFRADNSLIFTNVFTSSLEWKKLYFLDLWDFYKEPGKTLTHTLEFTDKAVALREKLNETSEDWDYSLKEYKKNLYAAAQVGTRHGYVMRHKDVCREREWEYLSNYDDFRFRRSALHVEQTAKKAGKITTINHHQKFINFRDTAGNQELVSLNVKSNLTQTDLVIHSKKPKSNNLESIEIMIPLPISACLAGCLSANLDHISEIYQEKYPLFPTYMTYGFKPFLLALISSGCNYVSFDQDEEIAGNFLRLFTYFSLNLLGVVIGQPITQGIAKIIHNKLLSFLVQSLTWTLLWNPSLFASEYPEIIPVVCMQLLQGLFFKVGEETYTLAKKTCHFSSSFWRKKDSKLAYEDQSFNDEEAKQVHKIAFAHP